MGLIAILMLAVALSFDTFAVALSLGMNAHNIPARIKWRYYTCIGLFHIVMSLLGWVIGASLQKYIAACDHWIAFLLLAFVGSKMIAEALDKKSDCDEKDPCRHLNVKNSCVLGFALSIDAVITGFTFGVINIHILNSSNQFTNVLTASFIIGAVAFIATYIGMKIGSTTGKWIGSKAEVLGGVVLILLGLKTLVSHMLGWE